MSLYWRTYFIDSETAVHRIPDRGPRIVATAVAFTAAITFIVTLRLWVRVKMVNLVGADDWTIVLGTLTSIALSAFAIAEVRYGAGRHVSDIPVADVTYGLKLNFISQSICVCAAALVKMSICFFLLRLAVKPIYRRICYGLLIFTGLYNISCTFEIVFQCKPIARAWDRTIEGQCMSSSVLTGLSYTYNTVCISMDFFLVALPILMLWDVKIRRRKKAMICIILGLGIFASTASIVRMTFINNYGKTGDFLWDSTYITIWSIIEINIGIITASMPALKPIFKCILEKSTFGSDSRHEFSNAHALESLKPSGITNDIRGNVKSDRRQNCSEESIIQQNNLGGISKLTEIRMDVEHLRDANSSFENDLESQWHLPAEAELDQ
ncbi:hypothetical protein RUND412_009040 [Rhizina undulata]